MIDYAITFLTVIFVIVCGLMIFVILMQRSKQEGLGTAFGGNTTGQLLGADASSFLVKVTVFLCVLFYVLSIALAYLYSMKSKSGGAIKDLLKQPAAVSSTNSPATSGTNLPSVSTLPTNPLGTNDVPLVPAGTEPSPLATPAPEVPVAPSTNAVAPAPATVPAPAAATPAPEPAAATPAPAAPAAPATNAPTPVEAPASTPAPAPAPATTNAVPVAP